MYKGIFAVLFLFIVSCFAQEHVESDAYKKQGFRIRTPLIKPKYPTYNLADRYVLTEKAVKGDPFAQHELGIRYILGAGLPIDTVKAAYWISKAASKNLPAANFNYGIMLNNGTGVEWNPFLAYKNFKIAAESGMEQGQYIFGLLFTDNLIVNKNLKEAYKWIKKSADKGFEEAEKVLAEFKKNGYVFSNDSLNNSVIKNKQNTKYKPLVIEQFDLDFYDFNDDTLSSEEESKYLNELLSTKKKKLMTMFKVSNVNNDLTGLDTTALSIINFAASAGSPEALLVKARFLEYGIGIKKNLIKAASNYLKAYRLGSYKAAESLLKISRAKSFYSELEREVKNNKPNAMYVWAGLIALGMDYSLTEKQAFNLLAKAEKLKHINSIIELGLAYYSGSLVDKDSLKAIEYLQKAVKLGSSEAEIRLAFIDIKNEQKEDQTQNLRTLKQYSNKGSVLAQAALANCYENGIAVKKNKAKAARLYRLAAQRGNEAAYSSLRKMYDAIRPSDEEFQIVQNY